MCQVCPKNFTPYTKYFFHTIELTFVMLTGILPKWHIADKMA